MTLPATGPLALTQIAGEFNGTNPVSLSQYYAGGGKVPAGTSGTHGAVPSSGAIGIYNFYGTSNKVPPGTVTFDVVGDHAWACPAGVTTVNVQAIGGGGSGGGITSNESCIDRMGGGGGGSSGAMINGNYPIQGGQNYTVRVGGGGPGAANGGNAGGASGIVNVVMAAGGNPGGSGPSCSYQFNGDFKPGGTVAGGNPGGKGFMTGDKDTPIVYHGGTGGAGWGGGGGGTGGNAPLKSQGMANGNPGQNYGAGGGGGAISETYNTVFPDDGNLKTQTVAGGAGYRGFVKISWGG